jgi:hypothetical protein
MATVRINMIDDDYADDDDDDDDEVYYDVTEKA